MQHLEVSGAVRHIYVISQLKVKLFVLRQVLVYVYLKDLWHSD